MNEQQVNYTLIEHILTLLKIANLLGVEVKDMYDQEIVRAYSTCAE